MFVFGELQVLYEGGPSTIYLQDVCFLPFFGEGKNLVVRNE